MNDSNYLDMCRELKERGMHSLVVRRKAIDTLAEGGVLESRQPGASPAGVNVLTSQLHTESFILNLSRVNVLSGRNQRLPQFSKC